MARTLLSFHDMDALEVHRHVRAALSAADELSRHEHAKRAERAAQTLAALRTTLGGIDLALGRSHHASEHLVDELHTLVVKLRRLREVNDRAHVEQLLDEVATLEKSLRERTPRASSPPRGERTSWTPKLGGHVSLLARLGLGLVPDRPLGELATWRVVGLCVVFAAAAGVASLLRTGKKLRRRRRVRR